MREKLTCCLANTGLISIHWVGGKAIGDSRITFRKLGDKTEPRYHRLAGHHKLLAAFETLAIDV